MTTSEFLFATFGVTIEQARGFLFDHLDNPGLIYSTAIQYDVTNVMLSEIVGGVSAAQVSAFFDSRGFDGAALNPESPPDPIVYDNIPQALVTLVGQELRAFDGL
jgi:hypothetical protein